MRGIVVMSEDGAIGSNIRPLLWHIPEDLASFQALTRLHTVIMGRSTWDTLPKRARPLPDRINIVVSRQRDLLLPGATVIPPEEVTAYPDAWVIGGAQVYDLCMPYIDEFYVSRVAVNAVPPVSADPVPVCSNQEELVFMPPSFNQKFARSKVAASELKISTTGIYFTWERYKVSK